MFYKILKKKSNQQRHRAEYLGFFEQINNIEVHGCQFPAWHTLQLRDDEQLTYVLQSGHLVHLSTDQEAHGLENAS